MISVSKYWWLVQWLPTFKESLVQDFAKCGYFCQSVPSNLPIEKNGAIDEWYLSENLVGRNLYWVPPLETIECIKTEAMSEIISSAVYDDVISGVSINWFALIKSSSS